jgi:streptogramin lyase/mono/diheme cytochrome c family protein
MAKRALLVASVLWLGAAVFILAADERPTAPMLSGTVRSASGEALGGVPVSARPDGKTFTRTVFTDERGEYFFPPFEAPFEPGAYHVWSQAVGFERTKTAIDLGAPGAARRDLVLKTIADFTNQLSGSEWLDALPADTHDDRRMKEIFRVNCTECHQPGLVLQNRFDEQGWLAMIEVMERATYHGWPGMNGARRTTIAYHKAELAKYLARVRGPQPFPLKFTLRPRPSGDAARVVVTEYDIPTSVGKQELAVMDGSNWAEGIVSGLHGTGGIHDVQVDNAGAAWLTDSVANDHRTIVKLDPKTGAVKGFKVVAPNARAQTSHGIARDANGIMWFDTGGMLARLDPATETFEFYRPPFGSPSTTSGQIDVAPNGNVWMSARRGALMFDQKSKTFKFFHDKTIGDGQTYGAAADANGSGWWTQFNMDTVVHADIATGKTYEFPMRPPDRTEVTLTPEDRDFYHNIGGDRFSGTFARPGSQAPRRLSTDKRGTSVWVANWWGENLARIDIKTKDVSYHKLPYGNPYNTVVDKNHVVWTNITSDDAVGKFDPKSGKWTIYKLPSIGAELRHIGFDDIRGDVWVPYRESDRAARLQFRTDAQLTALKRAAGGAAPAAQ